MGGSQGSAQANELFSSDGPEIDLDYLKDFLLVLQTCGVRAFSGYGVSVHFSGETPDFSPAASAESPFVNSAESPFVNTTVLPKDGWRNPKLWPQQNGRVLRFDGSFE